MTKHKHKFQYARTEERISISPKQRRIMSIFVCECGKKKEVEERE